MSDVAAEPQPRKAHVVVLVVNMRQGATAAREYLARR